MKRITTALIIAAALAAPMLALPTTGSAQASVGIAVSFGPPPLPYYPQPYAPGPGYIWTPGYWAYGPYGYYWVPGTWVLAPAIGLLWTPGWWGWDSGFYRWHHGYWGPHVGYYGGIDYGYGYPGEGYEGGYWRGRDFYYNRAVNRVDPDYIHHTYERHVFERADHDRVSYHGGDGGTRIMETAEQRNFARERHTSVTAAQLQHERLALDNPAQRFSTNRGRPEIAATSHPGRFSGTGVVRINKQRNTYIYRPVVEKPARQRPGNRNARPAQRPPEVRPNAASPPQRPPLQHNVPRTLQEQNNFRNQNRAVERQKQRETPVPQAEYQRARPPESRGGRHPEPQESKRPPRHPKNDEGRPPPQHQ